MTNEQKFTVDMIKGNHISWTEEAKITVNGTTVTIHRYKKELSDIWVQTSKFANRVAQNLEVNDAINTANNILATL
jgi:hypothetical protein